MNITIWDMDIPYDVSIDTNALGVDFVRISQAGSDDDCIGLNADQCREWARVLEFMAKELERNDKS